jgi:hypothetical protein
MKKKQIVEDAEGEEYLHKEKWRVVNRQFHPLDDRRKGATYNDLVANGLCGAQPRRLFKLHW